jgi:hypothetical protein
MSSQDTKLENNCEVTGSLTVGNGATITGQVLDNNGNIAVHDVPATATVSAKTGNYTVLAADFGKVMTNTGASDTITFTLPAASTVAGKSIKFAVLAAEIVNISPAATDGVFLNGSGVDNKDVILAGTIGTSVVIYSNGTNYEAYLANGVVTKQE